MTVKKTTNSSTSKSTASKTTSRTNSKSGSAAAKKPSTRTTSKQTTVNDKKLNSEDKSRSLGVVIMLLGLMLAIWFAVLCVGVFGADATGGQMVSAVVSGIGNVIIALAFVYLGYALYSKKTKTISSWQVAGWCFFIVSLLSMLHIPCFEDGILGALTLALSGFGGGIFGFLGASIVSLIPNTMAQYIVLTAFFILGLMLGTDMKIFPFIGKTTKNAALKTKEVAKESSEALAAKKAEREAAAAAKAEEAARIAEEQALIAAQEAAILAEKERNNVTLPPVITDYSGRAFEEMSRDTYGDVTIADMVGEENDDPRFIKNMMPRVSKKAGVPAPTGKGISMVDAAMAQTIRPVPIVPVAPAKPKVEPVAPVEPVKVEPTKPVIRYSQPMDDEVEHIENVEPVVPVVTATPVTPVVSATQAVAAAATSVLNSVSSNSEPITDSYPDMPAEYINQGVDANIIEDVKENSITTVEKVDIEKVDTENVENSSVAASNVVSNEGSDHVAGSTHLVRTVEYELPSTSILKGGRNIRNSRMDQQIFEKSMALENTLASFGVKAKVVEVVCGPAIIRYELQPAAGVKISKIVNLADDIALALAARGLRIEAPVPGKSVVGIEIAREQVSPVFFKDVVGSQGFKDGKSKISVAFGVDINGNAMVGNLADMPHLMVAGATGSGKSVCMNTIICSILFKAKPNEVKFIMVDPKKVELTGYNGLPHLAQPVVTEPKKAAQVLKEVVNEMERRYMIFVSAGVKNFATYNALEGVDNLPQIVVLIDELADLMMVASNDVEDAICRLAQMARAAGIHLVIATQRPSVDVITGLIKANIPSRIAFAVSSQIDSRTILDMGGAEKLLGKGDMLYYPSGMSKPLRVQGAFLSEEETERLVDFCKAQAEPVYLELPKAATAEESKDGGSSQFEDDLFVDACEQVIISGIASASSLQRRFRIGYNRAGRLIDDMQDMGIVSAPEGNKRAVLMDLETFKMTFLSNPPVEDEITTTGDIIG